MKSKKLRVKNVDYYKKHHSKKRKKLLNFGIVDNDFSPNTMKGDWDVKD